MLCGNKEEAFQLWLPDYGMPFPLSSPETLPGSSCWASNTTSGRKLEVVLGPVVWDTKKLWGSRPPELHQCCSLTTSGGQDICYLRQKLNRGGKKNVENEDSRTERQK